MESVEKILVESQKEFVLKFLEHPLMESLEESVMWSQEVLFSYWWYIHGDELRPIVHLRGCTSSTKLWPSDTGYNPYSVISKIMEWFQQACQKNFKKLLHMEKAEVFPKPRWPLRLYRSNQDMAIPRNFSNAPLSCNRLKISRGFIWPLLTPPGALWKRCHWAHHDFIHHNLSCDSSFLSWMGW